MRNIYIYIVGALLAVSLSVTALAASYECPECGLIVSDPYTSEHWIGCMWYGETLIDDPIEYIEEEPIEEVVLEPIETEVQNDDLDTTDLETEITDETGERLVVDISDESIEAIATALSGYTGEKAYQYEITADNGETYIIDTDRENILIDCFVIVYAGSYNTPTLTFTNSDDYSLYLKTDGSTVQFSDFNTSTTFARYSGQGVFKTNNEDSFGGGTSFDKSKILYSNRHLVDTITGELIYESSVEQSYKVSFYTGFDDLQFASQFSNDLILPEPEYDGKTFTGWYLDSECTVAFTPDYVFTSDITLYAKWADLPPMVFFHNAIFDSLSSILMCEPILYILSLMGMVLIIGIGKALIIPRLN